MSPETFEKAAGIAKVLGQIELAKKSILVDVDQKMVAHSPGGSYHTSWFELREEIQNELRKIFDEYEKEYQAMFDSL